MRVEEKEKRSEAAEAAIREKLAAEAAAAESLQQLSEAEKLSLEKNLSRLEQFALRLEQSKIAEYMDYLSRPGRMIRLNFLMGVARGFGFAVGLTVLSALIIYILQMVYPAKPAGDQQVYRRYSDLCQRVFAAV